ITPTSPGTEMPAAPEPAPSTPGCADNGAPPSVVAGTAHRHPAAIATMKARISLVIGASSLGDAVGLRTCTLRRLGYPPRRASVLQTTPDSRPTEHPKPTFSGTSARSLLFCLNRRFYVWIVF